MPNFKALMMACFLLCSSVFIVASSSIGLECGNTTDYKTKKKDNFNFLIALVVMGVLCILCSFGSMYLGVTMP